MTYEVRESHVGKLFDEITLQDLRYLVELLLQKYPKRTVLTISALLSSGEAGEVKVIEFAPTTAPHLTPEEGTDG